MQLNNLIHAQLPIHPRTGLQALGLTRSGRPIWPVLGGAPDDGGSGGDSGAGSSGGAGSGGAGGQGGGSGSDGSSGEQTVADLQRQVDEWKGHSRRHEARAKENADKAKKYDEQQAASASETEKAVKAAQDETAKQVRGQYHGRLAVAEVRALAGGRFTDPGDAVAQLRDQLGDFVDDDGDVDGGKVTKALDQLLKDKPYLASAAAKNPSSFDNGSRTNPNLSGREAGLAEAQRRFGTRSK